MKRAIVGSVVALLHLVAALFAFSVYASAFSAEPIFETQNSDLSANTWRFDEARAKKQIEAHGYRDVSKLVQDAEGTWRGTAFQYGRTMRVKVDHFGNFNEETE